MRHLRLRSLCRVIVAFAAVGIGAATPASSLAQTSRAASANARVHLAAALKAARASRWEEALGEYRSADAASPSPATATGIAESLDALRRDVEAYDAYRALLATYEKGLSKAALAAARARLAVLARVTGSLAIQVSTDGANVTVDGASVGESPLAAPVRVPLGLHRVRATRAGFEDGEAIPTVAGGDEVPVSLTLRETVRTGHVAVRSAHGIAAVLLVDGVERGPLPWDGELEPGPHDLFARSATLASPHQTVEVVRGNTLRVELQVNVIQAAVSVATADRKGAFFVDGKPVGEGAFEASLPVGPHSLRIERAGYATVEKSFVLREGESYAETFTLSPERAAARASARALEGVFGGMKLAGAFQVNTLNGDFSEPCSFASSPSATGCSAGSPVGGAAFGYVGYAAGPVGVDVLVGGQLDTTSASLTVQGGKAESYTVPRWGFMLAPRARVEAQTGGFRFAFAAGVGVALRSVTLSSHGVSGLWGSDPSGLYVAPAVTFDGSVHVRASEKVGVGLGVMYWAESAGNGVTLRSGSLLSQPAVVLSATQAMVLPYVGVEIGP